MNGRLSYLLSAWAKHCSNAFCVGGLARDVKAPRFSRQEIAQHLFPNAAFLREDEVTDISANLGLENIEELEVLRLFCRLQGKDKQLPLFSGDSDSVYGLVHRCVCFLLRKDKVLFVAEEDGFLTFYTHDDTCSQGACSLNALRMLIASDDYWKFVDGILEGYRAELFSTDETTLSIVAATKKMRALSQHIREDDHVDRGTGIAALFNPHAVTTLNSDKEALEALKRRAFMFAMLLFWALVPSESQAKLRVFIGKAFPREGLSIDAHIEKSPSVAAAYTLLEWSLTTEYAENLKGHLIEQKSLLSGFLSCWQSASAKSMEESMIVREALIAHLFPFKDEEVGRGYRRAYWCSRCLSESRKERIARFTECWNIDLSHLDEIQFELEMKRISLELLQLECIPFIRISGPDEGKIMRSSNLLRSIVHDELGFAGFAEEAKEALCGYFEAEGKSDDSDSVKASYAFLTNKIESRSSHKSDAFKEPQYEIQNGTVERVGLFAYLLQAVLCEKGMLKTEKISDVNKTPINLGGNTESKSLKPCLELHEENPIGTKAHRYQITFDPRANELKLNGDEVEGSQVFFGTSSKDTVSVPQRCYLSRSHAAFQYDVSERKWFVQNIGPQGEGSTNATVVKRSQKGAPVYIQVTPEKPVELCIEDQIFMGVSTRKGGELLFGANTAGTLILRVRYVSP